MNISLNSIVMGGPLCTCMASTPSSTLLLVEVNQIGGRMPVDPVTVAVPLHKDSVLVPLVRCEFLDLEPTDDPTLSFGSTTTFSRYGRESVGLFLVEHSVVLRFSGHSSHW